MSGQPRNRLVGILMQLLVFFRQPYVNKNISSQQFQAHYMLEETNNSKSYTKTKTVIGISSQQTCNMRQSKSDLEITNGMSCSEQRNKLLNRFSFNLPSLILFNRCVRLLKALGCSTKSHKNQNDSLLLHIYNKLNTK